MDPPSESPLISRKRYVSSSANSSPAGSRKFFIRARIASVLSASVKYLKALSESPDAVRRALYEAAAGLGAGGDQFLG